jgi:ubiquinone/menaquinone biosynthesis C-methylase UbiE
LGAEVTRVLDQEAGSLDMAVICDVYHHFDYPGAVIRDVRRCLKKGGKLVVIDFHRTSIFL